MRTRFGASGGGDAMGGVNSGAAPALSRRAGPTPALRRPWAVAVVFAAVLGLAVTGAPMPAEAASPVVRAVSVSQADAQGRVSVRVACPAKGKLKKKRCTGTVVAKVAGASSAKAKFSIKAKRSKTVRVQLSAKQVQAIHNARGNQRSVQFVVSSSKPRKSTVRRSRTIKIAAPLRVTSLDTKATVSGPGGTVGVTLACVSSKACKGQAQVTVGTFAGGKTSVSIAAKRSKTYRVALSQTQLVELESAQGEPVAAKVAVAVTAPLKLTVSGAGRVSKDPDTPGNGGGDDGGGGGDDGGGHDHGGGDDGDEDGPAVSAAYTNSWSPSEYDTCTRAEHEEYAVVGPDGKLYPGWHAPQHERADGTTCTFGHEHGDDPRNSDIYAWALAQYAAEAQAAPNNREIETVDAAKGEYLDVATGRPLGLPFGYGSERLTEWTDANPGQVASVHRHEDDPGHKVIVANDVGLGNDAYGVAAGVPFTDRWGATQRMSCDLLIKTHQGSHSNDATRNNTHELIYAASCNDGTQIFATTMSNYGNANELHTSCSNAVGSPSAVETVGSNLPDGEGGARIIPTADCVNRYTIGGSQWYPAGPYNWSIRGTPAENGWWWAGYEQWRSFNSITDTAGREITRYEPWFGIQNPSRYYVRNNAQGTNTEVAYFNDLAWTAGNHQLQEPWSTTLGESAVPYDRRDPRASFNGAVRDTWLATPLVTNRAGAGVYYADPWGKNAGAEPFTGALRVVVSKTDNSGHVASSSPKRNASNDSRVDRTRVGASSKGYLGQYAWSTLFYDYGVDENGDSVGVHAPN